MYNLLLGTEDEVPLFFSLIEVMERVQIWSDSVVGNALKDDIKSLHNINLTSKIAETQQTSIFQIPKHNRIWTHCAKNTVG